MKLWSGVITEHVESSKRFYVDLFGCEVVFDSDWFVLLALGGGELGFLKPGIESQALVFRASYGGAGVWITIDVEDVDAQFRRLTARGIRIEVPLRDEPWGDRHFVVADPNGIPVDVVQHQPPHA